MVKTSPAPSPSSPPPSSSNAVVSSSSSSDLVDEKSKNIRVYLRCRPPSTKEKSEGYQSAVTIDPSSSSIEIVGDNKEKKKFLFDYVSGGSGEDNQQQQLFLKVGKPITDTCIAGYNGTIFAYGQTGSGKTYTISGASDSSSSSSSSDGRGLLPRVIDYLFDQLHQQEKYQSEVKNNYTYSIRASFLEIYQEKIYDLLDNSGSDINSSGGESLAIREDPKRGVFVDGLSEIVVHSTSACLSLMKKGITNRHVGETAMNRESSRSHSVFTLLIHSTLVSSSDGLKTDKFSRFNLIDLAGSERQKNTGATGERLKEASNINKSLSALGNVIMALVEQGKTGKDRHVAYRDSKLTFLLKDSLGGNSLTFIVACISPAAVNAGETLSTLTFVQRAKLVTNNARMNEDKSGQILKAENIRLKNRIAELEKNNAQLTALVKKYEEKLGIKSTITNNNGISSTSAIEIGVGGDNNNNEIKNKSSCCIMM